MRRRCERTIFYREENHWSGVGKLVNHNSHTGPEDAPLLARDGWHTDRHILLTSPQQVISQSQTAARVRRLLANRELGDLFAGQRRGD